MSARPAPFLRIVVLAVVSLVTVLALGGCVGFTPDGGMAPVVDLASARLGREAGGDVGKLADDGGIADAEARSRGLLRRPLSAGRAVEVAFLRNRDLQAAFHDLGVSEADYVRASLPPEPTLSVDVLAGQGDVEVVSQVAAALFALALLPARTALAAQAFRAAPRRAAGQVAALATAVERQYWTAVAAGETVTLFEQQVAAAGAAAELAKQLGAAGNLNKLEQAREDVFHAELGAQLGDARLQAQAERERLTRLLGLWGRDIAFTLPKAMPPLPPRPPPARDVEPHAFAQRLDIAAMRRDLDALARSLGLTTATRTVSDLNLTAQNDHESAGNTAGSKLATENQSVLNRGGAVIDIKLPIYDWGESRVVEAREIYLAAASRLAQRAIDARSQAREAWLRYRGKHDLARYYAERVLPLRKTILAQTSLQTNSGLADVTQLLVDARGGVTSNIAAIAAKRDVFIAAAELKAVTTGAGPSGADASAPFSPTAASTAEP